VTYTPPEGITIGTFTADTLPASFLAPVDSLVSYKIYGTSEGAGVETESGEPAGYKLPLTVKSGAQSQDIPIYIGSTKLGEEEYVDFGEQKVYKRTAQLFNSDELVMVDNYYISDNGEIYADQEGYGYTENYFDVLPNETYSFINFYNRMVNTGCRLVFYDAQGNFLSRTNSFTPNGTNNKYTFTTASNCYKLRILYRMALFPASNTTIVQGSVTPDPIPPYYQPVDPPLPFPTLTTYIGKNTLSSTETLGDVEFTGDWLAIMGSTEDESIDIEFTVDAKEYIAFVAVDDGPSIQVYDTITMPSSADSFTLEVVAWGRERYTDTVYNALS